MFPYLLCALNFEMALFKQVPPVVDVCQGAGLPGSSRLHPGIGAPGLYLEG